MVFQPYHESWRDHPGIRIRFRDMFPGMRNAVAIFTTYCALEFVYNRLFPKQKKVKVDVTYEGARYEGAFEPKAKH